LIAEADAEGSENAIFKNEALYQDLLRIRLEMDYAQAFLAPY
jgi:hypothetical protein